MKQIKIVECPRDAMQGIDEFIPTNKKAAYINQLLKVGFDTIDFGSFVSPESIPQLRDTKKVLKQLELKETNTKLLAIVGNLRGAKEAADFDEVGVIGFPFSISDTFQRRNINSSVQDSFKRAEELQNHAVKQNKELVIYISMAFGNPYNDPWNKDIVIEWAYKLYKELEIKTISLSDTIGAAEPDTIDYLFSALIPELPQIEFGAHLHSTAENWKPRVEAAYQAGCMRFDGAIKGFGGCPMAQDELTGNMPTEHLLSYFESQDVEVNLNQDEFKKSMQLAVNTFPI